MAKPEWGKKRICPACNTKYYDLRKSPIICPSCGIEFDPDTYLRSRKGKTLSPKNSIEKNEDISNIDDIEIETGEEVVSDDDPILDISKDDKDNDGEVEIKIEDDLSFIGDDEISEEDDLGDDDVTIEVIDDDSKD